MTVLKSLYFNCSISGFRKQNQELRVKLDDALASKKHVTNLFKELAMKELLMFSYMGEKICAE